MYWNILKYFVFVVEYNTISVESHTKKNKNKLEGYERRKTSIKTKHCLQLKFLDSPLSKFWSFKIPVLNPYPNHNLFGSSFPTSHQVKLKPILLTITKTNTIKNILKISAHIVRLIKAI